MRTKIKDIKVDSDTKNKLDKMLSNKETYDNLIDRLLFNYKANKFLIWYIALIVSLILVFTLF